LFERTSFITVEGFHNDPCAGVARLWQRLERNEDEVELTEVVLAEAEEIEAKERDSSAFAGGTNGLGRSCTRRWSDDNKFLYV
jgi:hypothetical protein